MRRRRHTEEHENHERWLVSYADFITLLFAFFTVLYATSQADLEKQKEFEESFKQQMAGFVGGAASQGESTSTGEQSGFAELAKQIFMRPHTGKFPASGAGNQEIQQYVEAKLDETLKSESKETVGGVRHDAMGVRIQLAANKLFSSSSAELDASSTKALDAVGKLLKESNRKLIIEGHTDDEPIRTEKYPSNWELSAARATKIVRYLAARHKIPASKMAAVAYADQKPVAPNDTPENRARNRRIEIMIVTEEK